MIEITCDNCERRLEVDDADAGGKVACPYCGDVNRVPAEAVARAAPPPPPPAPESERPPEHATEREIRVVRPAMFRAHPFRFLLIAAIVLGGFAGAVWALTASKPAFVWGGLVVSVLGLGWLTKWWVATTLWMKVTITNKRTIRHEGIIRRHSTEVLHDHVRSVDINQNFLQRLCNVGYVGIDSAGQDDIEIEVRDMPGPYEIKKVIDKYRKM